ncbi:MULTISPECIES: outer membrane protein assembly factor BamB family protein [Natrialbaceae]|uniref:outer membrane protein assembly factor BamB family protein n=1 Tax=Natrialbaceae TaxID=1644061 RepID=UPI00207C12D2|nr:PQQ-binding-like beta-propeller repeat protein [Natronococcus sp. CG52]
MSIHARREVLKYAGLAAAGGVLAASTATAAENGSDGPSAWTSLRGNAGNTGYVSGESGPDESATVTWEYDHGGPVAVVDGNVFLTVDGAIHALDAEDGELVGETDDVGAAGAPAVVDDTVYVGGDRLTAIDLGDGEVDWDVDLEPEDAVPSPIVVDDTVFVVADGTLYALEADGGDEAWRFEPDGEGLIERTVAAAGGAVFTTDGETLYAHEIDDGSERWTNGHGEYREQTVVATDRAVSVQAGGDDRVAVYETETGDLSWARDGAVVGLATSDHVYTLAEDDIVGYYRDSGDEFWQPSIEGATFGRPVGVGPTLYVGISDSSEGTGVAAFDVVTDELEWVVETETGPEDLAFADGTIYASDDGLVAIRSAGDEGGTGDEDEETGEDDETDEEEPADEDDEGGDDADESDDVLSDDEQDEQDEQDGQDGQDGQDDGMPGFTTGASVAGGALTLEWLRRKAGVADEAEE